MSTEAWSLKKFVWQKWFCIKIHFKVWISWSKKYRFDRCQMSACSSVFVLSQQRLDWWTLKPLLRVTAHRSWTDCVTSLRQISVTAQFIAPLYLEDRRKILLRGVRAHRSKDVKRRAPHRAGEREPFSSSFYMFFSSPWAWPIQIGLSHECYSTWSPHSGPRAFLWPSSVLFSQDFPFLLFSPLPF